MHRYCVGILFFSVFSASAAIYCRYGESVIGCIHRNNEENTFFLGQVLLEKQLEKASGQFSSVNENTGRSETMSENNGQHETTFENFASPNQQLIQINGPSTFWSSRPLTPFSHETAIKQPSEQQSLDTSSLIVPQQRPPAARYHHMFGHLLGRLLASHRWPLISQKEEGSTINIHANNVYLHLSPHGSLPSVLESAGTVGSEDLRPHSPLFGMISKPQSSLYLDKAPTNIHTYTQNLGHGTDSFALNALLKIFSMLFKGQKNETHETTETVERPLVSNKLTETESLPLTTGQETIEEISTNNTGETHLIPNITDENFNPLLRIDEYFATHENRTDICLLPSDSGVCLALFMRFYFDYKKKTCELFVYGGCGGNENSFSTYKECLSSCSRHIDNLEDICLVDQYICRRLVTDATGSLDDDDRPVTYYFDSTTRSCKKLSIKCSSEGPNTYPTLRECLSNCYNQTVTFHQ